MPSPDTLADIGEKIHVGSEFVTIQHYGKKFKWVVETWGTFFRYQNHQTLRLYLDGDSQNSTIVSEKIEAASERFLKYNNNNRPEETVLFRVRKGWKLARELEENKYIRAIAHLLTELKYDSVSLHNQSLVFKLINIIFFQSNKPRN